MKFVSLSDITSPRYVTGQCHTRNWSPAVFGGRLLVFGEGGEGGRGNIRCSGSVLTWRPELTNHFRMSGVILVTPTDMQVGFTFSCGMQGCAALPSITTVVPLTARLVSSNEVVQWICFTRRPTTRHKGRPRRRRNNTRMYHTRTLMHTGTQTTRTLPLFRFQPPRKTSVSRFLSRPV